jgi:endoglucanase
LSLINAILLITMDVCTNPLLFNCVKRLLFPLLLLLNIASSFAQTNNQLSFISVVSNKNTGQDYSPWLNNNPDSLVEDAWVSNNFIYADVTLKLKYHSRITHLKFYDLNGVFDEQPAEIYALNGTEKIYLGKFTGPGYMIYNDLELTVPVEADAILVHKFCNNIPKKILVYGTQDVTKPNQPDTQQPFPEEPGNNNPPPGNNNPPPVSEPEPVDSLAKIPVDASRWFQLNNTSNGLQGLFDGETQVDFNNGWGKIFDNYDAYYPVAKGERIDLKKIKFYCHTGNLGDKPLTVSVIDSTGKRTTIATYAGGYYNRWVGPYLSRPDVFKLDTEVTNIKYIVLNCWYQFPSEIEFYGDYTAAPLDEGRPTPEPEPAKEYIFKNYLGINAFEWDFEDPTNPDSVDPARLAAMKTFTQIRHYMDWEKLESQQGGYTYSPVHSGGWSYDAMYKACKDNGMLVLADLKTLPNWLLDSYPDADKDHENVPVRYGANFSDPKSYVEQARVAFQFVARYGSNTGVNKNLLSVNANPRWTNDPINKVRVGLGYIKYIECDNERDKWWKGRKGYQTAYEYAANLSAFYDGHKNTMGPAIGVKNADPNMKVVMGGLASASPEYLLGMIEWCKINRGYNADGTVNLCWDVINYHWYSHDAQMIPNSIPTRGMAPEVGGTYQKAKAFIDVANKYAAGMPVWVTEAGYDANPNSPMRAIPIGNKSILKTQADWILRTALLYARAGVERVFFYQAYDDNYENPTQYGSSGLLNQDKSRKPAANFLYQVNKLIGKYTYKETISTEPMVDRYELDGKSAYVLFVPDEKGRTADYTLELPGTDSAYFYTPKPEGDIMGSGKRKFTNGKLALTLTETPVFVIPMVKDQVAQRGLMSVKQGIGNGSGVTQKQMPLDAIKAAPTDYDVSLYPNPSAKYVNISFNNTNNKKVNITLADAVVGRVYGNYNFAKSGESFSESIDISHIPDGVCLVMIQQDDKTIVKRLIKKN